MTEPLLILIIMVLVYIAWKMPKSQARQEAEVKEAEHKEKRYAKQLASLHGQTCEFTMKDLSGTFGYSMGGTAVILDTDQEWVLLSCPGRKGEVKKVLRISEIEEIKEIRE